MSVVHRWLAGAASQLRKALPDAVIIVGGIHAVLYPEEVMSIPEVDLVCTGDGEEVMLRVVRILEASGADWSSVSGIGYRDKAGRIVLNERASLFSYDSELVEDRDMYYKRYPRLAQDTAKRFIWSRGCPYKGSFCYNEQLQEVFKGHGQYIRRKDAENLIEEIRHPDNDEWRQHAWEGGCEDLHIVEGEDGTYYMNYTTCNAQQRDTVSVASSRDLFHWKKHGPAFRKAGKIGGRSGLVVSKLVGDRLVATKIDGKYWMYYTHPCALAWSENLIDWTPTGTAVWPGGGREAGAIALLRDDGILLMTQGGHHSLGAWTLRQSLIDRNDLKTVLKDQKEPFIWPE